MLAIIMTESVQRKCGIGQVNVVLLAMHQIRCSVISTNICSKLRQKIVKIYTCISRASVTCKNKVQIALFKLQLVSVYVDCSDLKVKKDKIIFLLASSIIFVDLLISHWVAVT